MPYVSEHAVRLRPPSRYVRFRRENNLFGPGIDVVWGVTEDGAAEIQALRFDARRYTLEQVQKWIREHNMDPIAIEPATGDFSATGSEPEPEYVEREARLIVAGEYPDKGVVIDEAHLQQLAESGPGSPVIVEHKPTLLLGLVQELWRRGKELWARLRLKREANQLIEETGVKSLSVGILRTPEGYRLREVSLTSTPRIPTAQLFANDTPSVYIVQETNPVIIENEKTAGGIEPMAETILQPGQSGQYSEGQPKAAKPNGDPNGGQDSPTTPAPTFSVEQQLEAERARAEQLQRQVEHLQTQIQFAQHQLLRRACAELTSRWTRDGKLTPAAARKIEQLLFALAQHDPEPLIRFSEDSTTALPDAIRHLIEAIDALPTQPTRRAVQYLAVDDPARKAHAAELKAELEKLGFSVDGEIPEPVFQAAQRWIEGGGRE